MASPRRSPPERSQDESPQPRLGLRGGSPVEEAKQQRQAFHSAEHPGGRTQDVASSVPLSLSALYPPPSAAQATDPSVASLRESDPQQRLMQYHLYPWPPQFPSPLQASREATDSREGYLPTLAQAWPPIDASSWAAHMSRNSNSLNFQPGPPIPPLYAALKQAPVSVAPPLPQIPPLQLRPPSPPSLSAPIQSKGKPFEISLTKRCNGPRILTEQYGSAMKGETAEERCMKLLPSTDRSILCEGCRRYRKLLKARLRRMEAGAKSGKSNRRDEDDSSSDSDASPKRSGGSQRGRDPEISSSVSLRRRR